MACFPLATALRSRGYKIVFSGTEDIRKLIETEGFDFFLLNYFQEYSNLSFKEYFGLFLQAVLDPQNVKKRYRYFYTGVQAIECLVESYSSDIVFVDDHLGEYSLYLMKYNIPIAIINTTLSTRKVTGIPPLTSTYIPRNNMVSIVISELLWVQHLWGVRRKRLFEKVVLLCKDDSFFQRRYCHKNNVDWQTFMDFGKAFQVGVKNVPILVLAPKALEFCWRKSVRNEHYLNLPVVRNESQYYTEEYEHFKTEAILAKTNYSKKIIYCSFGTIVTAQSPQLSHFLRELIEAINNEPDWIGVIAAKDLTECPAKRKNVFFFPFVPQLDVLHYANVMVTLGGLTSIKECLQTRVPMLVYPFNTRADQPGNAVRLEAGRLGLRGDLIKDDRTKITSRLKQSLALRMPDGFCDGEDQLEGILKQLCLL
jgi:UDP:flavonoid glycosyltransferase YjiC (YdhE family)